jgi:drug/metabolite transporter (DMT)-like permease
MPIDRTARGILISFASYLIFSLSDASVKLIQGALPPYESAFFGSLFGLIVLAFVRRPGEPWTDIFATDNVWLWLVRFLVSPASVIGSVVAFTHLPMAEAMALMFLLPVHSIILARLLLGGVVVCGLLALPELVVPTPTQWAKLASYGLLAAVGNVLTMRATRLTPAAWLGPTQYSQILWALLFGYVLFGDTADGPMLLGLVLIAGSGLLTLLPRRR